MRLGDPAHRIVSKIVHKTLLGSLFVLSKTGSCAVISSQNSFQIYRSSLLPTSMPPLAFFESIQ